MSTLHGSWILENGNSCLFIWAETWKPINGIKSNLTHEEVAVLPHCFCLDRTEFKAFLSKYNLPLENFLGSEIVDRWKQLTIYIPTQSLIKKKEKYLLPVLSEQIEVSNIELKSVNWHGWQVEGLCLNPLETILFLQNLPLGHLQKQDNFVGAELDYFTQVYRWSLDLIARNKFLPGIFSDGENISFWQPLIDSAIDQTRFAKFVQLMPAACYADRDLNSAQQTSQLILLDFLNKILDVQIRQIIVNSNFNYRSSNIQPWLRSLSMPPSHIDRDTNIVLESKEIKRLKTALDNWTFPIQSYLANSSQNKLGENLFNTCLVLEAPSQKEQEEVQPDWQLKYALQALDDRQFLLAAETIWQHPVEQFTWQGKMIEQPQETLLKGLGLAARLYAPIETSLQTSQPTQCQLNPIEVYQFIRAIAWQLQDNGISVVLPPGLTSDTEEQRLGVQINAELTAKKGERLNLQSLLKYKLEIAIGDRTVSKQEFEKLLAQKSPLVEIDGKWIALQPADVRAAQAILNKSNEEINLSVEDALRLSSGDTKTLAKLPVVKFEAAGVLKELIDNLSDNKSVQSIVKPKDFIGELRPYQAKGVGWLAFLEQWGLGACLADDMGLGKTIQTIAFLLNLKEQEIFTKPVLLVCPTSVLNNWEREVKKFAPTLSTFIHHGDRRSKEKDFLKAIKTKNLVITSYSLIHRDINTLSTITWQGLILDEAQNIKNPQTKQSQSVRKLKADFRISLTGTPVENRLADLWSIMDFLNPGFLGNQQFFQKRFATPIEKYGDRESLQIMRSLVQPFILRRLKTDKNIIQDLPEKQEMNVFCGLSAEQAELYQQLVDESLNEIESASGIKRRGMILTLILRLKQICNHPLLIEAKKTQAKNKKEQLDLKSLGNRSGKLLRLEEMLEEAISEGDRSLIFTQFSEWGEILQTYLQQKLSTEILFLYGATSRQQRQEMVDRFQNDPNGPPIFILSLKAGGTGLNLTRATHVFHIDRWWNPAVENQATDRAFRIGQKRNVQVHKFVCTGTLEEKINDTIESKQELAEQTVDAGEQWLTELDTDRLRSLLLLDRSAIIDEDN